jgi:aryl-alcohol dehydrogenase-like predicted oxidoreductase
MPSVADRLVLGTWGLAGSFRRFAREYGYGAVSASQAGAVLEAAWDGGLRALDLAWSYGDGIAAQRVAAFQSTSGKRFAITCKTGRIQRDGALISTTARSELRAEVDRLASLVGPPAQVLLKDPDREVLTSPLLLELCAGLQDDWPGARVGIASHELDALVGAPAARGPWVAQIEYHGLALARSRRAARCLKERGWTVTGMQPLAYGYATGKFGADHVFAADDWRRLIPARQHAELGQLGAEVAARLSTAVPEETAATTAVGLCLADPLLDAVVIGPKTPDQLRELIRGHAVAADRRLRDAARELWERADAA